jgi:predicted DNA-binding antitoxin AbrB/MazE fold protein
MKMKTVHAVYENGVFRPLEQVELPDHTQVEFEPRAVQGANENGQLDAIYSILLERYASGEHNVAARHNEHQP